MSSITRVNEKAASARMSKIAKTMELEETRVARRGRNEVKLDLTAEMSFTGLP